MRLIENSEFNGVLKDMMRIQKLHETAAVNISVGGEKLGSREQQIIDEAYIKLFDYYDEEIHRLCKKLLGVYNSNQPSNQPDNKIHVAFTLVSNGLRTESLDMLLKGRFPAFSKLPYKYDAGTGVLRIMGYITEQQLELCRQISELPYLDFTGFVD